MDPESILTQLDECAAEYTFPMLDNGYTYHVDQRLTIYRDSTRWLMIIDILNVNNRTLAELATGRDVITMV